MDKFCIKEEDKGDGVYLMNYNTENISNINRYLTQDKF